VKDALQALADAEIAAATAERELTKLLERIGYVAQ
jgi:hypothetical protein